ncbi:Alpha/Beta hydrolase protein [Suillus bovinus]|uniref:Alpha/Beta hydrolase protein n=1 Tax=Suillus bovinus TaxID=48563 RepID=UPI001B86A504|nr:Alpha/Beta hydrolase protein [Suillus bovinus]KAG2138099.1 Alpha/Beta hydrolase protein [Suillus bovinus]
MIQKKIHHTYHLQFLKDVVLARVLDNSTFNVLNSCIIFNQINIINHVQQDTMFLHKILSLYVNEEVLTGGKDKDEKCEDMDVDSKPNGTCANGSTPRPFSFSPPDNLSEHELTLHREVLVLIQQLCIMGKNVPLAACISLFRSLVNWGILFAVQWAFSLSENDPEVKTTISIAELLFKPFHDIPDFKTQTEPVLKLSREKTNLYLYLSNLVCNFAQQHGFRIHFSMLSSNISACMASFLKAWDKHLHLGTSRSYHVLLFTFSEYAFFIFCANVMGSPYGSASPVTIDPETGKPYGPEFPQTLIHDDILHKLILDHLEISSVAVVIGGSMGRMAVLKWPLCTPPGYVHHIITLVTSARHSAWCISWGEAQGQSIYSDPLYDNRYYTKQPSMGVTAARMATLLTYWLHNSFESHFGRRPQVTPVPESSAELTTHIPDAELVVIPSPDGHDGFLLEFKQINKHILRFLRREFPGLYERGEEDFSKGDFVIKK